MISEKNGKKIIKDGIFENNRTNSHKFIIDCIYIV